jgi:hypothetical protein
VGGPAAGGARGQGGALPGGGRARRGPAGRGHAPRPSDPFAFFAYFVSPDVVSKTPVYQLLLKTDDWDTLWDNISPGRMPGNGNGTNPSPARSTTCGTARVPAVLVVTGRVYDVSVRYEGSFQGRLGGANIDLMKWPPTWRRPDRPNPFRALSWSIKFPATTPRRASAAST